MRTYNFKTELRATQSVYTRLFRTNTKSCISFRDVMLCCSLFCYSVLNYVLFCELDCAVSYFYSIPGDVCEWEAGCIHTVIINRVDTYNI